LPGPRSLVPADLLCPVFILKHYQPGFQRPQ
jgi:hypothetical protein